MHKITLVAPLVLLAFFYFAISPLYIQGGDTAELVAAGYFRWIPHPPGYPLYVWLQHIWTHLIPFKTVFWRASILSSILGILSLSLMTTWLTNKKFLFCFPVLLLGLNSQFIESSVLPDVFSLHTLFICLSGFYFLFSLNRKKDLYLVIILALSLANHHTTFFLFPCFLYLTFINLTDKKMNAQFVTYSLVGVLICFSLYLSLFLCNPEHPFSWGTINDLNKLWLHFARADYGTFSLAATDKSYSNKAFVFLIKNLLPFLIFLLTVVLLRFRQNRAIIKDPRFTAWGLSIFVCILFSFLMNVDPVHAGAEVLRRFHVMPMVMICILAFYLIREVNLDKKNISILILSILPCLAINLYQAPGFVGLRNDSVIEDYSNNIFNAAIANSPSLIVIDSDSAYFGVRYIQSFHNTGFSANSTVIALPMLFHPWYVEKIKKIVPLFVIPHYSKIMSKRILHQDNDVIVPNINQIRFFFNRNYKDGSNYKVTFFPLGRMIEKGEGVEFKFSPPLITNIPNFFNKGPQHFSKNKLYYEYSHFYLAHGAKMFAEKKIKGAQEDWESALKIVPYAYPAMNNLCEKISKEYSFCSQLEFFKKFTSGFY
jgi:hypothetical protein